LLLASVLIGCAVLYLALGGNWLKFSRAEVFFSECGREMLAQGNMITPLYHGQPFFDKPILTYWLIIASFKTLGVSHLAARLPSIFAALGTIGITAGAASWISRTSGRGENRVALLSAMILGSSFMFLSFAYLCMSDMLLVLFDTITMCLLFAGTVRQERRDWLFWFASVSAGFAFLIKGPVGVVLPVLAFLIYLVLTGQLNLLKPRHFLFGIATVAAVSFPWFFSAYQANGSWSLAYFFFRENVQRFAGATYDTHKPVWFMVQSLFLGFLPWSVLIPPVLWSFAKQIRLGTACHPQVFLWTWVATVTAFFSFSRGKIDYYELPVYPALAILMALYLTEPQIFSEAARRRISVGATAVFLAIIGGGTIYATMFLPVLVKNQSLGLYANFARQAASGASVGVHTRVKYWIDEITFQSGREATEVKDAAGALSMLDTPGSVVIVPDTVFDELKVLNDRRASGLPLRVLDRREVASKPFTPKLLFDRGGRLNDLVLYTLTR
jgi:4-amino-4-deoxy-L-arabinose transferase-like glycosyltransferase